MPHHIGPNRKIKIVTRKVFENFNRCDDLRCWQTACEGQSNDSWREIKVSVPYVDSDMEYLRQWLLKNGAKLADEHVLLSISW